MQILPETALLRSFLIVAQELSFRRAAERLALDQSALSRRIQKLEAELGYALFERSTREVTLTAAGVSLYRGITQNLNDCRRSIDEARRVAEGLTGRIRIGYMAFAATELMPQAVARFKAQHPDVLVEMRYIRTQAQKIALTNEEIDIGLLIGPYDNPDFHSITLAEDRLFVVTPRRHALTAGDSVAPAEIMRHPVILGDMIEWGEYRYRLEDTFGQLGLTLKPELEASNTLALLGLVAAGLGVTIYPQSLVGFLGSNVEVRPIRHPLFKSCTVMAWKRTNHTRAVTNFVALAKGRGA